MRLHVREALGAPAPLRARVLGVSMWTGLVESRARCVGFPHCDDARDSPSAQGHVSFMVRSLRSSLDIH